MGSAAEAEAEAGTESNVIDMLNDLIQLNYSAIQAYEAAIDRIDNGERQRQLTAFKEDHERHTEELDHVVRELHGKPVNGEAIKHVMTARTIAIADMMSDRAVLKALKSILEDIKKAYRRAAGQGDLPHVAVAAIQAGLDDERRHHDCIEEAIAAC